jgi:hypothetical protein
MEENPDWTPCQLPGHLLLLLHGLDDKGSYRSIVPTFKSNNKDDIY